MTPDQLKTAVVNAQSRGFELVSQISAERDLLRRELSNCEHFLGLVAEQMDLEKNDLNGILGKVKLWKGYADERKADAVGELSGE